MWPGNLSQERAILLQGRAACHRPVPAGGTLTPRAPGDINSGVRDPSSKFRASRPAAAGLLLAGALGLTGCSQEPGRDPFSILPENPVPEITTLEPAEARAGGGSFVLKVHGLGFGQDSVVRWNGADRPTSPVSDGLTGLALQIAVTAQEIAEPAEVEVTVFNPPPGGGVSEAAPFFVCDPDVLSLDPSVGSVEPELVEAGAEDTTLTIDGSDFEPGAVVVWTPALSSTGTPLATTFVSGTRLTAALPASVIGPPGSATVRVVNPPPCGATSNAEFVTVL
jgi:hypothetical protein